MTLTAGISVAAPIIGSVALGLVALLARIGTAVKGPLPTALLTPMPTPMGDLGAAARMAWSLDDLLIVVLGGASTAVVVESPLPPGHPSNPERWRMICRG